MANKNLKIVRTVQHFRDNVLVRAEDYVHGIITRGQFTMACMAELERLKAEDLSTATETAAEYGMVLVPKTDTE